VSNPDLIALARTVRSDVEMIETIVARLPLEGYDRASVLCAAARVRSHVRIALARTLPPRAPSGSEGPRVASAAPAAWQRGVTS